MDETLAVLREAGRWGVEVVWCDAMRLYPDAPASSWDSALLWPEPVIACTDAPDYMADPLLDCQILHEMAHVIVGDDPRTVDEVASGMLWIEYEAAGRLGLTAWSGPWMDDYAISVAGKYLDWSDATEAQRASALEESRRAAVERGLIDRRGRPTYRRRREV
jgi:hypothetical protein